MTEQSGNQTPDTPGVSETELRGTGVEELRQEAREAGVEGAWQMKKDELVQQIAGTRSRQGGGGDMQEDPGPDGGRVRTGDGTSSSIRYSQEVTSPDDDPERPGRSLVTTHHDVIRQWAQERGGRPATVGGTEHGDHLGVLRLDFGDATDNLREVSWEEWFDTFDQRRLNFIYQERTSDGSQSNFFRLENPDREDA